MTQQIKDAIDSQLTAKGMTKTDNDNATMYVGIQTSITQQQQWNAYGMGGGWRFGGGMATAQSSTIQIGTLGVDFYDPATKQLVWRGVGYKDPKSQQECADQSEPYQSGCGEAT